MMDEYITLHTAWLAKKAKFDLPSNAVYTLYTTERKHKVDGKSGPFGWEQGELNFSKTYFRNFLDMCDSSNENYTMFAAPTKFTLQKWLREQKGIILYITPFSISSAGGWSYNIQKWNNGKLQEHIEDSADSVHWGYEKAFEEGLIKSLQILIDYGDENGSN